MGEPEALLVTPELLGAPVGAGGRTVWVMGSDFTTNAPLPSRKLCSTMSYIRYKIRIDTVDRQAYTREQTFWQVKSYKNPSFLIILITLEM